MKQWSRRRILKTFFLGTALSNAIGRSWSTPVMIELQALQPAASRNQTGLLHLDLRDYPVLAEDRGSVRISTSAIDPRTNRQSGLFAPVIVNRAGAADFHVMSAACTHEDCVVRRLDQASNRMVCPCHGSEYLPDGTVARGPAVQPLRRFHYRRAGDILSIELPDVFYEMAVQKAGGGSRLEISFLAFEALTYEIYFRGTLEGAPERVSFAASPAGALDRTELEIAGDFARVYVERPGRSGFFQVAMKSFAV